MRSDQAMAIVGTVAMAGVLAPGASTLAAPTQATPTPPQHCTTALLTLAEMRAGATSVVRCFDTFPAVMAAIGASPAGVAPSRGESAANPARSSVLAIHYDGAGGTGDSLTVTGAACEGGGISLPPEWDNRFSSTRHQLCTKVKHWVDVGYAGASQLTEGPAGTVANLNGTLTNAVSSIRYW